MYLIFDSSANGSPRNYKAPLDDLFNWPRLVHLSWITLGADMKPLSDHDFLIKPEGFVVPQDALEKHHIEEIDLTEKGHNIKEVLTLFSDALKANKYVFAHNLNYNESIVGSEFYRHSMASPLIAAEKYCLMHEGTYYCKIPGKKGYKWPSLQEMHSKVFNKGYTPSNHARADVIAATRCFIALYKAGAFDDILMDDDDE